MSDAPNQPRRILRPDMPHTPEIGELMGALTMLVLCAAQLENPEPPATRQDVIQALLSTAVQYGDVARRLAARDPSLTVLVASGEDNTYFPVGVGLLGPNVASSTRSMD